MGAEVPSWDQRHVCAMHHLVGEVPAVGRAAGAVEPRVASSLSVAPCCRYKAPVARVGGVGHQHVDAGIKQRTQASCSTADSPAVMTMQAGLVVRIKGGLRECGVNPGVSSSQSCWSKLCGEAPQTRIKKTAGKPSGLTCKRVRIRRGGGSGLHPSTRYQSTPRTRVLAPG